MFEPAAPSSNLYRAWACSLQNHAAHTQDIVYVLRSSSLETSSQTQPEVCWTNLPVTSQCHPVDKMNHHSKPEKKIGFLYDSVFGRQSEAIAWEKLFSLLRTERFSTLTNGNVEY